MPDPRPLRSLVLPSTLRAIAPVFDWKIVTFPSEFFVFLWNSVNAFSNDMFGGKTREKNIRHYYFDCPFSTVIPG